MKIDKFSRVFIPHINMFIFVTVFYGMFVALFFVEYAKYTENKIYVNIEEYGEIDIHHICNVTGCNGIYMGGDKFYSLNLDTGMLNIEYMDNINIPKQLIAFGNISIRKDLSFIIRIHPDKLTDIYFVVGMSHFYAMLFLLYIAIQIGFNIMVYLILKSSISKEKVIHDMESSKDKAALQFDNLMFFIENLNHEVNTPMFILSRKVEDLKKIAANTEFDLSVKDRVAKDFTLISTAIEQIGAVMQRTREVKRINKISEDRTIFDILDSTFLTIKIMRAEDFIWNIDERLKKYILDQNLINNGIFINILTNHIKNSMEAFSTEFSVRLHKLEKNILIFDFIDNGNGIPKEIRKKIFNKGFTTKGPKSERGSGLSINKNILESSGGILALVPSEEGTIFRIGIPIIKNKRGDNESCEN